MERSGAADGRGCDGSCTSSGPRSFPRCSFGALDRNIRFGAPGQRLPLGTTLGISVGALTKAIGEALGYLGLTASQAESGLTDDELHKLRHASFPAHD
jgi:hypothetical protein